MDSSLLLRLLQNAPRLETAIRLPAALLPQAGQSARVLEARVLGATLLQPAVPGGSAGNPAAVPRYRVQLDIAGYLLRATLAAPLPAAPMQPPLEPGQTVQLSVNGRGQLHLLGHAAGQHTTPISGPVNDAQPAAPTAPPPPPQRALSQLQHWARILLPQQQPVHELVPVLQRWLASAASTSATAGSVDRSPAQQLARQWLAQLATPERLSDAGTLRTVLAESGALTESLWRQALTTGTPPPPDQKSLLLQLLSLLQRPAGRAPQPQAAPAATGPAPAGTGVPPQSAAAAMADAKGSPFTAAAADAGDAALPSEALLRQLSAAIARTQLHQLDSLGARQSHSGDTQQANATWSFEVPVRDGHHTSSLELHIQRRDARRADPAQIRWKVDLRLDLHEYGRFSAELNLLGQQVSAVLWAEQADTHQRVREHLAALRLSLEAVGVNVRRLDCRHGMPPSAQPLFRRQLVDVRT